MNSNYLEHTGSVNQTTEIDTEYSDNVILLLQNIMTFNQASIMGKSYGDPVDEQGNPMDITVVSFTAYFLVV